MNIVDLERTLKVLADKSRLQIIERIHRGQRCGCELIPTLNISQPTLSHHLKVLSHAGFIKGVKTQNKIHYSVQIKRMREMMRALDDLFDTEATC